jgi:hypothetical protein
LSPVSLLSHLYPKQKAMNPITRTYESPAVCGVEFVETNEIESMTTGSEVLESQVILKTGKAWKACYLTAQARHRCDSASGAAGLGYKHSLEGAFPGEDKDQVRGLMDLENRRLVVKIKYSDGTNRLLGDLENPVRISRKKEDGTQVLFSWESEYPLLFLTES